MTQLVTVKKRKTSNLSHSLFFVIPKTSLPKAVERNKIKRRARCILRPFLKKGGYGYTVMVRRGVEKLSFQDFKTQITRGIS